MANEWEPELTDLDMEQRMESQSVPESDRDEVRRFAQFLRRRKAKSEGDELPPAPVGMREWLLGDPQPASDK